MSRPSLLDVKVDKGAQFSPCRTYRYMLERAWDGLKPVVCFIGLNPSTADERIDDPTIRRCLGYARSWGYGCLVMSNLFAYRSTSPKGLMSQVDPIGPENDFYLIAGAKHSGLVVACWGNHGSLKERSKAVKRLLTSNGIELHVLGLTNHGEPKHPLYLRGDLQPVSWQYEAPHD